MRELYCGISCELTSIDEEQKSRLIWMPRDIFIGQNWYTTRTDGVHRCRNTRLFPDLMFERLEYVFSLGYSPAWYIMVATLRSYQTQIESISISYDSLYSDLEELFRYFTIVHESIIGMLLSLSMFVFCFLLPGDPPDRSSRTIGSW